MIILWVRFMIGGVLHQFEIVLERGLIVLGDRLLGSGIDTLQGDHESPGGLQHAVLTNIERLRSAWALGSTQKVTRVLEKIIR